MFEHEKRGDDNVQEKKRVIISMIKAVRSDEMLYKIYMYIKTLLKESE